MAEVLQSLSQLGDVAKPDQPAAPVHVKKVDAQGRAYATGKRKNAIARVWIKPGSGKITVNEKEFVAYFARPVLQMILKQPIIAASREGQFDIVATVIGGGLSGQAGAVRHGISKALTAYEPDLRGVLKQPLQLVDRVTQYDVVVSVKGGGLSGQAGAVRHGISKALTFYEPELRGPLKKEGFLTRDSRVVERKKFGKAKARRSFQFSKR